MQRRVTFSYITARQVDILRLLVNDLHADSRENVRRDGVPSCVLNGRLLCETGAEAQELYNVSVQYCGEPHVP